MIRHKVILEESFQQDIIEAIGEGCYELTSVCKNRGFVTVETEASGFIHTKKHGTVKFSFETERLMRTNEK